MPVEPGHTLEVSCLSYFTGWPRMNARWIYLILRSAHETLHFIFGVSLLEVNSRLPCITQIISSYRLHPSVIKRENLLGGVSVIE